MRLPLPRNASRLENFSGPLLSLVFSFFSTLSFTKAVFLQTVLSQPPASSGIKVIAQNRLTPSAQIFADHSPGYSYTLPESASIPGRQLLRGSLSVYLAASCSENSTWAIRKYRLRLKGRVGLRSAHTLSLARHPHAKRPTDSSSSAAPSSSSRHISQQGHSVATLSPLLPLLPLDDPVGTQLHSQIAALPTAHLDTPTPIHKASHAACSRLLLVLLLGTLAIVTSSTRAWGSTNESTDTDNNWSRLPRQHLAQHPHSPHLSMDHGDRFRQPLPQYASLGQHSYNGPQSQLPTLPPLQSGTSFAPSLYSGHNSNPQTPVTSASNGGSTMPQPAPLRPIQPSPSYMPTMSSAYSQAPLLSTSAAHSNTHHQLAPSQGMSMSHPSLYPHPPVLPNQEPEPLHVVGQQGRRGVLPTHPGRPAPAAGKTPTNATKNAEGKYECPHCNKTYLHLKHLKRHLLRRTFNIPTPTVHALTFHRHR